MQTNWIHTFYRHTAKEKAVDCKSYSGKFQSNSISSSSEIPSKSSNISLLPLCKTCLHLNSSPQSQSFLQQSLHHFTHLISAPSVMPYRSRDFQKSSGSIAFFLIRRERFALDQEKTIVDALMGCAQSHRKFSPGGPRLWWRDHCVDRRSGVRYMYPVCSLSAQ